MAPFGTLGERKSREDARRALRPKDGACGEAAEPPLAAALRAHYPMSRNPDSEGCTEAVL